MALESYPEETNQIAVATRTMGKRTVPLARHHLLQSKDFRFLGFPKIKKLVIVTHFDATWIDIINTPHEFTDQKAPT